MRKLSMEELNRSSVEAFKRQKKLPVTLILDSIRSMHNVGSIFRTADGFAVEKIILCGITGRPPHREIEKTALGATRSVEWDYEESVLQAVHTLKASGYQVWAVEQAQGSTALQNLQVTENQAYALIFGNEVLGVDAEVMEIVDGCIEIPQGGTKHSLNVVVSAGIVLWQFFERLYLPGGPVR